MSAPRQKAMLACHQPHYLPWLGYIDKISKVEMFCCIDIIPFDASLYQHRNKTRTEAGAEWLILPVQSPDGERTLIKDICLDPSVPWNSEHWAQIQHSYARAPYFAMYADKIRSVYRQPWHTLTDLNINLTHVILDCFGIKTKLFRASQFFQAPPKDENLLVALSRKVGAISYMSGAGGNCSELDRDVLETAGITHIVQEFKHPAYPQIHGEFMPNMNALDLLFNCGPDSERILSHEQ